VFILTRQGTILANLPSNTMGRILFHLGLSLSLLSFCIWQFRQLNQKVDMLISQIPVEQPLIETPIAEMPLPIGIEATETTLNLAPDLQIVKLCQGQTYRELISEANEPYSAAVSRTIAFIRGSVGNPEILAARVTNLSDAESVPLKEFGVISEFGNLDDLKSIESVESQNKFEALLNEAADLCLGTYTDIKQYELDFAKFKDEIESGSTTYLSMDIDLKSPDTQVTLYYKLAGQILQKDLSGLLNPI